MRGDKTGEPRGWRRRRGDPSPPPSNTIFRVDCFSGPRWVNVRAEGRSHFSRAMKLLETPIPTAMKPARRHRPYCDVPKIHDQRVPRRQPDGVKYVTRLFQERATRESPRAGDRSSSAQGRSPRASRCARATQHARASREWDGDDDEDDRAALGATSVSTVSTTSLVGTSTPTNASIDLRTLRTMRRPL